MWMLEIRSSSQQLGVVYTCVRVTSVWARYSTLVTVIVAVNNN